MQSIDLMVALRTRLGEVTAGDVRALDHSRRRELVRQLERVTVLCLDAGIWNPDEVQQATFDGAQSPEPAGVLGDLADGRGYQ